MKIETEPQALKPDFDFSPWTPPFRYDADGTMILDSQDRLIVDIRGWGFLTGKGGLRTGMSCGLDETAAEKIQDRLGEHITKFLNESSVSDGGSSSASGVSVPKQVGVSQDRLERIATKSVRDYFAWLDGRDWSKRWFRSEDEAGLHSRILSALREALSLPEEGKKEL